LKNAVEARQVKNPGINTLRHSESDTMKTIIKFADFKEDLKEDILIYEVSDQALEAAAGIMEGQAKNATISFCSGLDTCPS
jgi:hypothetical protein